MLTYWSKYFPVLLNLMYWVEYSPVFQLWPEVPDKTLNWPGSAVSQSADGVALNLDSVFWLNAFEREERTSEIRCFRGHTISLTIRGVGSPVCSVPKSYQSPLAVRCLQ